MSKIAKQPITIHPGVAVEQQGRTVSVQGPKGRMHHKVHEGVTVQVAKDTITIAIDAQQVGSTSAKRIAETWMQAGTTRALLQNMITGVHVGFQKVLLFQGVGYRAQVKNNNLVMNLGFSHDVNYHIPEDVSIVANTPTEVVISGIDKQRVGQVAADIRMLRPPERYKGKGIHYQGVSIVRKEVKKKK